MNVFAPAYTPHHKWITPDNNSLTVAQALLAVTARTNALVEALADNKKILIEPRDGVTAIEIRVYTESNSDTNILEMLAAAGEDHYTPVGRLTCIQGTQIANAAGTRFFATSIIESLDAWLSDTRDVNKSSPVNEIARFVLNTHGYDRFLITASTKASTTISVQYKEA